MTHDRPLPEVQTRTLRYIASTWKNESKGQGALAGIGAELQISINLLSHGVTNAGNCHLILFDKHLMINI